MGAQPSVEAAVAVGRHRRASEACHALREALRGEGLAAVCVRKVQLPARRPMWVISNNQERADTVAKHGPPAVLGGYSPGPFVRARGSFVKADVRYGAILWDITLPGVSGLVEQGESIKLFGPMMLLRLTRRALAGWRGLLASDSSCRG
jgi:hypothetical protein